MGLRSPSFSGAEADAPRVHSAALSSGPYGCDRCRRAAMYRIFSGSEEGEEDLVQWWAYTDISCKILQTVQDPFFLESLGPWQHPAQGILAIGALHDGKGLCGGASAATAASLGPWGGALAAQGGEEAEGSAGEGEGGVVRGSQRGARKCSRREGEGEGRVRERERGGERYAVCV